MKSKNHPNNAKPCIADGKHYGSLTECADAHFVCRNTLTNYIRGRVKKSVLQGLKVELAE